ncbi:DUF397 domain-containing protein [Actinokineospora guangxiensis]|uniref:DUF397 domain-containing protein n=1 Tax=Actinokineospora guangxiensis TaxID=1490288 RepID=A0ABW0ENC4_9PSEU
MTEPLIEQSGLQVDDLVRQVRCPRPTIFRLLSGDALPGWPVVLAVLGLVGATDEQRTQALTLWEIADVPTSAVSFAKALPVAYRRFRLDEMEADVERTLDTAVIPGMLQTRPYTEALALRNHIRDNPEEWNKAAPAERHERQALRSREDRPLRLVSLIDESALRRVVGGSAVMVEQLDRLLAAGRDHATTVRVIPFSAGPYPASAGSMTLFYYDGERSAGSGNSVEWRKSSRSASQDQCVEVSVAPGETRVRDTKARDRGALRFDAAAFRAFLTRL